MSATHAQRGILPVVRRATRPDSAVGLNYTMSLKLAFVQVV